MLPGWCDDNEINRNSTTPHVTTPDQDEIQIHDQPSVEKLVREAKEEQEETLADAKKEEKDDELKKAIKLFAERVPVAGVEDIYKSKIKAERWMWYLTMIAVILGVIFKCRSKTQEYRNPRPVYDYYPMANYLPPFPNLSICGPMSLNKNKFKELLIIPQKVQNLIKRKKLDMNEIIDFTLDFWRYDRYPVEIEKPIIAQASLQIMDATLARFPRGMADFFLTVYPKCEKSLSDCSFYGQTFDCCQVAQFTFTENHLCYFFDLNRIPRSSETSSDVPSHLEANGLSVNFNFNWPSVYQEIMQNGFLITIDYLYDGSNPVAIPAGADALVTLRTTRQNRLSNCLKRIERKNYEFFDDSIKATQAIALANNFLRTLTHTIGCDPPILTHVPDINGTVPLCMAYVIYGFKTFGALQNDLDSKWFDTRNDEKINRYLDGSRNAECQRWAYEIASASYGYVQYKNGQENRNFTDESWQWSRIRIFFPSATYLLVEEELVSPLYVALCNVGGSMTMYCGVSMISFIHITIYGGFVLYVIFKYLKKNRVTPAAD